MIGQEDREGFAAFLLRMRAAGIADRALMDAIEAVPRRAFLPAQWQSAAWSARMIPIACGETVEGLDQQAVALSSLAIVAGNRVLEVGTGSGYTAAVMARLGARVVSVERFRTLADQARQQIETQGIANVVIRHADGSEGLPAEGPFDRIVVWAAFETLPRGFVDQLSTNGVMIAPIGGAEETQTVARLSKVGSRFERQDIGRVRLQPIVRGLAAAL